VGRSSKTKQNSTQRLPGQRLTRWITQSESCRLRTGSCGAEATTIWEVIYYLLTSHALLWLKTTAFFADHRDRRFRLRFSVPGGEPFTRGAMVVVMRIPGRQLKIAWHPAGRLTAERLVQLNYERFARELWMRLSAQLNDPRFH
jgi:hypothetical protein